MRAMVLGVLLTAGLCCLLACFGLGGEDAKDAQEPDAQQQGAAADDQPKPVEIDPRHQRRIKALNDPAAEDVADAEDDPLAVLNEDIILGDLPNAKEAAEYFVTKFVQTKYKTNIRFVAPESLMKYMKETQEWRAYGTMTSKDRRQAFKVECFVKFIEPNQWECRRIHVDDRRAYSSELPSNEVELAILKVGDNGRLLLDATETAEADEAESAASEADEKAAAGKLKMARLMLKRKPENARQRLQEVVDKYPDTNAAAEAEELLSKFQEPSDASTTDAPE